MRPSLAAVTFAACAVLLLLAVSSPLSASAEVDSATPGATYYDRLRISRSVGADPKALKLAYRKRVLASHPDLDSARPRAGAGEFEQVTTAFEVLSDPRTRARYDHGLDQTPPVLEYDFDATRDWSAIDRANGFAPLPRTKTKAAAEAERSAEAKLRAAKELFERSAEESEAYAIWGALGLALAVAMVPALYLWWGKKTASMAETGKRKAASSDLKATQAALRDLQAEQERAKQSAKEEERAYARELKAEREEAAATAAAERTTAKPATATSGEWTLVAADQANADAAAKESDEDDDDDAGESASRTLIKCQLCKKTFKSQQQMENHEQSNQHKKAVQQAEKASRKAKN